MLSPFILQNGFALVRFPLLVGFKNSLESFANSAILLGKANIQMADNEEISPAVSDEANTPDKRVNSTPSTERSKAFSYLLHGGKVRSPQAVLVVPVSLALHRVKTVTLASRIVDTRLTRNVKNQLSEILETTPRRSTRAMNTCVLTRNQSLSQA